MLNGKYSKKKDLSYLLGYDSEIEDSVLSWRKRRKKKGMQKSCKVKISYRNYLFYHKQILFVFQIGTDDEEKLIL